MNQSELHSTPPECLSRTEGQWRCETHTSSWRVEGTALVAKEYVLLLGMRRWTGVICFTVARAAAEICNTAAFSYLVRNPHLCVTTFLFFFVFWSESGDASSRGRFSNRFSSNCLYNVFFWCSQLKDHLLIKKGARIVRQGFSQANGNKQVTVFFFVVFFFAVMGEPWKQDQNYL